LDALITSWAGDPEHGDANQRVLTATTAAWLPRARDAVTALAGEIDAVVGADAAKYVAGRVELIPAELAELGLAGTGKGL
jgi:phenol/toluene 2-monooxygenase (NADH) P1/A1